MTFIKDTPAMVAQFEPCFSQPRNDVLMNIYRYL